MIKTLAVHIKGYVRESVLTPLLMILEVIMETVIPWLMATMIDDGINKGNMQHIVITGLWMLLCALIALFALRTSRAFRSRISTSTPRRVL